MVAGLILKLFGSLFLVLGVIALIAGLAAAATGYDDEMDNRGNSCGIFGPCPDDERSEANQAMVFGGLGTAGTGAVAALLGTILLVIGVALDRPRPQQIVVREDRVEVTAE